MCTEDVFNRNVYNDSERESELLSFSLVDRKRSTGKILYGTLSV